MVRGFNLLGAEKFASPYFWGAERVAWTQGYNNSTFNVQKNTNNLYIGVPWGSLSGEAAWVTDVGVDLTDVKTVVACMRSWGTMYNAYSDIDLVISDAKMGNRDNYVRRSTRRESEAAASFGIRYDTQTYLAVDTADLRGTYYIRVHRMQSVYNRSDNVLDLSIYGILLVT